MLECWRRAHGKLFLAALAVLSTALPAVSKNKECLVLLRGAKTLTLQAEIADTEALRETGLMNRKKMAKDRGMLFVFDTLTTSPFWMKDTLLPLTILFIDAGQKIVGIQDMAPLDQKTLHYPDKAYLYALEINQGVASRIGLKKGDFVTILGNLKRSDGSSRK